ncbi:MAG TPA: NAD(P)H-hydrate dehydratase [Burkholderiaceae bacterium]
MQRIIPGPSHPLLDTAATRHIEQAAQACLPAHALMQRAGLAVARLALALAPHARTVWIACGPGNNGGDGLEAALQLKLRGWHPVVTCLSTPDRLPPDARAAHARALAVGVQFSELAPAAPDLCIDALLGIGASRAPAGRMAEWIAHMNVACGTVLSADIPTGLQADTGVAAPTTVRAHATLSLLTLKPGLFTAQGRDHAGAVWFDALDTRAGQPEWSTPTAWLGGAPGQAQRPQASHKGNWGDVAVAGGATGMTGAALLAATAALHAGAGRVLVCLLDGGSLAVDAAQPECMFRTPESMDWPSVTTVCGCGGGAAVLPMLPTVLASAPRLVLDADALNAIAGDPGLQTLLAGRAQHGWATVLTPHPLEAARLLGCTAAEVQADRQAAACSLAGHLCCVVVLKGSGSIITAPGMVPVINPTGNALLATAGTGDVLAGLLGARLAAEKETSMQAAFDAACNACYAHGLVADTWPASRALTALALARSLRY